MKALLLIAAAAALSIVALACSSSAEDGVAVGREAAEASATARTLRPDERPLVESPVSPDGLKVILATTDVSVGDNRFGFVVATATGLVRQPAATVSAFHIQAGSDQSEPGQTELAVFRPWPYGTRGLYTTRLEFDKPGRWGIDVTVLDAEGPPRQAQLLFDVESNPSAPPVGSPAIPSSNKTIHDVERISQLTTGSMQDADLYQTTIADAVASEVPTVVVMASPAFCLNAVCGPQVEVLQRLKNTYRGKANFIHVDFYDNPEEIQGDLARARLSPTVVEWELPSSEWSFVIDRKGTVSARFEAFATFEELEQALLDVL